MERADQSAEVLGALIDPELADLVDMVLSSPEVNRYRADSAEGSVTFERRPNGRAWDYEVLSSTGRDPLAIQSTDRLLGHQHERAERFPERTSNAYPFAFESVAQFFDSPHAPDLLATHTARHMVGGYLGQHGSLGTVQARAPFLAGGAGIRSLGTIDAATRVVNIAPTLAALLGVGRHSSGIGPIGAVDPEALLARQDGEVEFDILDGSIADHVVVALLDGCNANLLADVIAAGEAPHLAEILERGVMFGRGSMASLPTATLANHTTALTGAHPGHSGIVHNTWLDRTSGREYDLLDLEQMWWAASHVRSDVETLFEAVQRARPGAFTSAGFEFCDRGASYSTFAQVREGAASALPDQSEVRHLDGRFASHDEYAFMSRVDHVSLTHTLDGWNGSLGNRLPALSWCSLALTDSAGHASGPHGDLARAAVRDSDARVGELMEAVQRSGVWEDTAFVVIADHGMEQADPHLDATWDEALAATGVPHRDLDAGLIYLGDGPER